MQHTKLLKESFHSHLAETSAHRLCLYFYVCCDPNSSRSCWCHSFGAEKPTFGAEQPINTRHTMALSPPPPFSSSAPPVPSEFLTKMQHIPVYATASPNQLRPIPHHPNIVLAAQLRGPQRHRGPAQEFDGCPQKSYNHRPEHLSTGARSNKLAAQKKRRFCDMPCTCRSAERERSFPSAIPRKFDQAASSCTWCSRSPYMCMSVSL